MFSVRFRGLLLDSAAGLLFPPRCAVCGCPTGRGRVLCRTCHRTIVPLLPPRCSVCAQPYGGELTGSFRCMNCGDRDLAFDFATAAYRSRGAVRRLVHRLKYEKAQHLRHYLGRMLAAGFRDPRVKAAPPDALVPVPLHPAREREREFNQAQLLASAASARLGLPVLDCLIRCRYTRTQTNFHREERFANLEGAFRARREAEIAGKRLALVDDVLTTGSTADACARVLREAGASAVVVITVARG